MSKLQDSLRELEVDLLAGELLVHRGEGLCLMLDVGLLGLVQVDLEQTGAVQTDPEMSIYRWRKIYWAKQDFVCRQFRHNTYLILLPTISAG